MDVNLDRRLSERDLELPARRNSAESIRRNEEASQAGLRVDRYRVRNLRLIDKRCSESSIAEQHNHPIRTLKGIQHAVTSGCSGLDRRRSSSMAG